MERVLLAWDQLPDQVELAFGLALPDEGVVGVGLEFDRAGLLCEVDLVRCHHCLREAQGEALINRDRSFRRVDVDRFSLGSAVPAKAKSDRKRAVAYRLFIGKKVQSREGAAVLSCEDSLAAGAENCTLEH